MSSLLAESLNWMKENFDSHSFQIRLGLGCDTLIFPLLLILAETLIDVVREFDFVATHIRLGFFNFLPCF